MVASNLATAAAHRAIDEVWAVAPEEGDAEVAVRAMAREVSRAQAGRSRSSCSSVWELQSGKGRDEHGVGSAARQGRDRVHFFDADITNFDASWIDGAEAAADRGFR